jgi:hypothetical protein
MTPEDIIPLKMIHHKYYRDEFDFPEFEKHFLNAYVVEQDEDIITAGGVRQIAEVVGLTNKGISVRKRKEALEHLLSASVFTADVNNYNSLHAFVDSGDWENQLRKTNWSPIKGKGLIFHIR